MRFLLALFAMLVATPASTATLLVDGNGILTGATGVNVNGTLYDVTFIDGTCVATFGGCDSVSDFDFSSVSLAYAAAQALMSQVFLDSGTGNFDSTPSSVHGCGDSDRCVALIPYTLIGLDTVYLGYASNNRLEIYDDFGAGSSSIPASYNYSLNNVAVWARFTPSPVPEPSTWAMMLFGFGGIGFAMRRKHEEQKLARVA